MCESSMCRAMAWCEQPTQITQELLTGSRAARNSTAATEEEGEEVEG